ncbi:2-dehydro-3-deoxygalactonokinase [Dyadobacter aurulentus]|uniref:2-dehydro-3-deoxygalactonokinase n=1 Tax=Dyadobacter sp. UC 10 TaxID=2605428 RepID=UPI0011F39D52|nr:2-dehydro-3-deoxygalactonokinase [Dyadobacter sp. UC 10]KAA0993272.1 2-dehydro-3-deoxygalactonokinase [Dyadobacter sp. UC 10]
MSACILSCDWGTTSFRLRLIRSADREVLGELVSRNGVSDTFSLWKEQHAGSVSRIDFFKNYLKKQIEKLGSTAGIKLDGIPVIISGMASSSIGMQEIAYAEIPFALDGSDIQTSYLEEVPGFPHEIILLSGVRSDHDVMRGEETQLIGLNELVALPAGEEAIFIFPGTHSKHLYVSDGKLVGFRTFMTGEIFDIVARHSILKDSIEPYQSAGLPAPAWDAFLKGVQESGAGVILNSLFKVRTNQLFGLLDKEQNGMYLSGLLIGSEMQTLAAGGNRQVVLCSGNNLFELYKNAANALGLVGKTIIVPPDIIDKAAVAGHLRVFGRGSLTLNKSNYE